MEKVDRGKLYGSRSIETLDADSQRCNLATLASDGRTLIPNGGTAMAHLSPTGAWVENDTLAALDREGHPLAKLPSSFEGPIALEETVDEDHLLEHSIRLTYALAGEVVALVGGQRHPMTHIDSGMFAVVHLLAQQLALAQQHVGLT